MKRQIHIVRTDDDPLSRCHIFDPPLQFDSKEFSTLEQARWYIILVQQGESHLAEVLLHSDQLRREPRGIVSWIKRQEVVVTAEWIFRSAQIYTDLLLHQLRLDSSPLRSAFTQLLHSIQDPANLQFVVTGGTNEYVWSCGYRTSHFLKHPDDFPGFNIYGVILGVTLGKLLKNDLTLIGTTFYDYAKTDVSTSNFAPKTMLLLSDSHCQVVESVNGGEVYPISEGTYSDIAELIRVRNLDLTQFQTVVINCGTTNPADTSYAEWRDNFRPLGEILQQTLLLPQPPTIIFSCAIPHPGLEAVPAYPTFIHDQLANTAVRIVNWSTENECPFRTTTPPDDRHWSLFDGPEDFYVSHSGFRVLWTKWCETFYPLRAVDYKLTTKYKTYQKQDLAGPRQQQLDSP